MKIVLVGPIPTRDAFLLELKEAASRLEYSGHAVEIQYQPFPYSDSIRYTALVIGRLT